MSHFAPRATISVSPTQIPCRNGDACHHFAQGTCKFYHQTTAPQATTTTTVPPRPPKPAHMQSGSSSSQQQAVKPKTPKGAKKQVAAAPVQAQAAPQTAPQAQAAAPQATTTVVSKRTYCSAGFNCANLDCGMFHQRETEIQMSNGKVMVRIEKWYVK